MFHKFLVTGVKSTDIKHEGNWDGSVQDRRDQYKFMGIGEAELYLLKACVI